MNLSTFAFSNSVTTKSIIVGTLILPSLALADTSPFYIGANVTSAGKTNSEISDTAFGGQILLGYDLSQTWSLEASTGYYGHIKTMIEPDNPYSEVIEERFSGTDISLLGSLPLSRQYNLYAGAGALLEGRSWSPITQFGVEYEFDEQLTMKFGYKFVFNNDPEKDLQVLGLGIRYHFPTQHVTKPEPFVYDDIKVASTSEKTIYEPKAKRQLCKPIHYIVKQNDWLIKIAQKQQISFEALKQVNGNFTNLKNINLIYPGDVVFIPNKHCN